MQGMSGNLPERREHCQKFILTWSMILCKNLGGLLLERETPDNQKTGS